MAAAWPAASVSVWNFLALASVWMRILLGLGGLRTVASSSLSLRIDLLLLDLDLLVLVDDLDLHLLGHHLLVGDLLLECVGQLGLDLLTVDLFVVGGFLHRVVLFRLGDLGLGLVLGRLPPGALRLTGSSRRGRRVGLGDGRVTLRPRPRP